jgi:hypothetical protein
MAGIGSTDLESGESSVKRLPSPEPLSWVHEMFTWSHDQLYFNQFRKNPNELSYLAVHDFRYLHMKNLYYYQMELLQNYPPGRDIDSGNVKDLRELLAGYCMNPFQPVQSISDFA